MRNKFSALLIAIFATLPMISANALDLRDTSPTANPKMVIVTSTSTDTLTTYTGSAPIHAEFYSNVANAGDYTPLYEWHVYKQGKESEPYLVRYDQDFTYDFVEADVSYITLKISFVNGNDTISYSLDTPFSVSAYTSVLNVPNAFSPNGDGNNDTFHVKDDYKSIIEFHGYIFNRWGTKLFEWTNITDSWDGTYKGKDVPDGAYYVRIIAKGADGQKFDIKQAVNILRGYTSNSAASSSN